MKTLITILCMVCACSLLQAQTIKQAEYFIDTDKGVGKNKKISLAASSDSAYQINLDLSGIPDGNHKLYIRIKDSKKGWSEALRKDINVVPATQLALTTGEYFFDADPGFGNGDSIIVSPQDTLIMQNFIAVTSALNAGSHKLYIRMKDNENNWSFISRKNVDIIKDTGLSKITAAEYFFSSDKGFGNATQKIFATPSTEGKFKFKIPYNKIPANADTLFIRVKDSVGDWSITKIALFTTESLQKTDSAVIANSTAESTPKSFSIFPNPASQIININYKLQSKSAIVQIFDINGKLVLQNKIVSEDNATINISKLIQGAYILQLTDGNGTQTAKFIKQ